VIPKTCQDDRIGGVIEALASESYRSVVEVFYESALKMKYSRDSYSGQCIDIIRATSTKSLMFEYQGVAGGGYLIGDAVLKNADTLTSSYAATVDAANQKFRTFAENVTKMSADLTK